MASELERRRAEWVASIGPIDDRPEHAPILVTVLDTATGRTARAFETPWQLAESNWSCDCNRSGLFDLDEADWPEGFRSLLDGLCAGERRFLVVSVDAGESPYTLAELNDGYPADLVARFVPAAP